MRVDKNREAKKADVEWQQLVNAERAARVSYAELAEVHDELAGEVDRLLAAYQRGAPIHDHVNALKKQRNQQD